MVEEEQRVRYDVRRISKIGLAILLPLILLPGIAWYVLRSDHAFVIRKVEETARDYFDLNLKIKGYRLEWTKPYPLIRFHLRDLSIANQKDPGKPYIRINSASSEFNPWDLITGDFRTHPFQVDSAWIFLHTDSIQYLQEQREGQTEQTAGLGVDLNLFPSFQVNYLDFHQKNDYLQKSLWAKFSHFNLAPELDDDGEWAVHLRTDVFFEGLTFNGRDGGYLTQTPAAMELYLYLTEDGRTLEWQNSKLKVGRNTMKLYGQHYWADTNRLHLQISADQILLDEVRPLLNQKINNTLKDISADQPITAHLTLDKKMVPGLKDAIELDFQTKDAEVRFKKVSMSSATLRGTFSSDCDQDGVGDPLTSCISFQQLQGNFFDVLPTDLRGVISNMEAPHVEATGSMNVDLPRLNSLLSEKGKATFARGRAYLNFQYDGGLDQLVDNPFDDRDIAVRGNAFFKQITLATADRAITSPSLSGYLSFDQEQTLLEDIDLEWMGSRIELSGNISNLPEFFFYKDQTLVSNLTLHFDELNLNNFKESPGNKKNRRSAIPFDGQRLEALTTRLATNLNGQLDLTIDKITYDTLYLTDLSTRLRLFSPRLAENADTGMVRIDSLMGKFMGRTPVYAHLLVSGDRIPKLAIDLELPSARQPFNTILPKNMELTAGEARMTLQGEVPLRSVLPMQGIPVDFQYQGRIFLNGIALQHQALAQTIGAISGPIVFDRQKVDLDQLQFEYDGSPFTLNGSIEDYALLGKPNGKKSIIDLRLNGKSLRFGNTSGRKGPAEKSQHLSPPELFRDLGYLYQHATGNLKVAVDELKIKDQVVHPFLMSARLAADEQQLEDHQLKIDSFMLGFGPRNYFRGSAVVKNPDQPRLEAKLDSRLKLEELGQLLPSKYIEMRSGGFTMDLIYSTPLYDTLNARNYLLNAALDGHAQIQDGELFYNFRDFSFQRITGNFQFDQNTLFIRQLDLDVNGNRLMTEGHSKDFFAFFVLPDRRAHIDLDVRSPRFDFSSFTAPQGLGKDTMRMLRKAEKVISAQLSGLNGVDTISALQETAGYIDQLLDKGSIEMTTDFTEVVYQDFRARQVAGQVSLAPDTVQLHNLNMNVADGTFSIAGLISNIVKHRPKMEVSIQLDQNNVREIFRQFDNFGQTDLNYKNVEGLISADLDFRADVNSNYDVLPESMYGDMKIKLAGGELLNLKLFDKLSGFIFRNRGMDHVILDTLELHSHIRGSDLYVDKFSLHSSPFDFEAQGRYSLGQENNTRMLFHVPIANLFNRHIPLREIQEEDSERSRFLNILIEARYKKGKMRFIWKPIVFNKKVYRLLK